MKKIFALPLAVLFFAACSDSTAPVTSSADLTPRYAKPGSGGGGGVTFNTYTANAFYDFNSGVLAALSGTSIATDIQPGVVAAASDPDIISAPSGEKFIGRFIETKTVVLFNVTNGGSKYNITFDLYVIGSWDGKGKQAQNGAFLANVLTIGYRCTAGGAISDIFATTFSNQKTVQQDFPAAVGLGGNKAATGSYLTDALNYKSAPTLSNTPVFRSFGDVTYRLNYSSATNPCGIDQPITFVLSTTNPFQQSTYDESWGVDNVRLQAGS